ncbi:hypothetical protein DNTS_010095 [Danionella cerebrum]|uniref:PDZ and LIM domain protein 4 n=1 Tax=Danionella cerebrum TaxID=2873325 RepID=A0A553N3P3_9TELE|nr:hypothetical protein DNTS_010095 [Danionella translucida]TRY60055.1 hypothetical protein DNTS_010095 [Danionella translucida]
MGMITPASKAAQSSMNPGDTILAINGESTENMTHMEAQNRIKACSGQLVLHICSECTDRLRVIYEQVYGEGKSKKAKNTDDTDLFPQVMKLSERAKGCKLEPGNSWSSTGVEEHKTSPFTTTLESDSQTFRPISSGYSPTPQSPPPRSPVTYNNGHYRPLYNNPSGLYTQSNGSGGLPKQMAGLSLGSPQSFSPELQTNSSGNRNGFDPDSDVYRMLQDPEEPASEPKQSGSHVCMENEESLNRICPRLKSEGFDFQHLFYQQQLLLWVSPVDRPGIRGLRSPVKSPVPKLTSPIPSPLSPIPGLQKLPQCTRCAHGIVGTIVKARDKLYHPDCFQCDDCGLNLKHRGYFYIHENLFCETHAKERVQPPEGYDVVAVYPNATVQLV